MKLDSLFVEQNKKQLALATSDRRAVTDRPTSLGRPRSHNLNGKSCPAYHPNPLPTCRPAEDRGAHCIRQRGRVTPGPGIRDQRHCCSNRRFD
eukprot:763612-Hanusia_phi.AAC.24